MIQKPLSKRVAVVGTGVICSLGKGIATVCDAMSQGASGVAPLTLFDEMGMSGVFGYEATGVLPRNNLPRCTQLLLSACEEAWHNADCQDFAKDAGIVVGSGLFNSYLLESTIPPPITQFLEANDLCSAVGRELGIKGGGLSIAGACAAGNYATAHAVDMIRDGEYDLVLAAGCDTITGSMYGGITRVNPLVSTKCAPFSFDRKGMLMGEGAGAVVLERMDRAIASGRNILAEVIGCGYSCDAAHPTAMTLEGITAAMFNALADAGVDPKSIDYICAHGTGTKLNDVIETAGIKAVFGQHAYRIPVSSLKSMIGHTSGASGSIGTVATIRMMETGMVYPTINHTRPDTECDLDYVANAGRPHSISKAMINAFGFGGYNCCLVLGTY